jgi:hypothetical protein
MMRPGDLNAEPETIEDEAYLEGLTNGHNLGFNRCKELVDTLVKRWREKAAKSREESARIRKTIKEVTDADLRCIVRADLWDDCANELSECTKIHHT